MNKSRRLSVAAFACAGLLLGAVVPAVAGPAATITNGNFSSCVSTASPNCTSGYFPGSGSGASGQANSDANSAVPTGWATGSTYSFLVTPSSLSNGLLDLPTSGYQGSDLQMNFGSVSPVGGNFLIIDGNTSTGTLTQTVNNLITGGTYAVSFYQAAAEQTKTGNSSFTPSTTVDTFTVSLGGSSQNAATMTDAASGFVPWSLQTLYFVATAATEVLGFSTTASGAPPFLALDGVSIAQVPEPASYGILGMAVVGLLMVRRRQLRRSV